MFPALKINTLTAIFLNPNPAVTDAMVEIMTLVTLTLCKTISTLSLGTTGNTHPLTVLVTMILWTILTNMLNDVKGYYDVARNDTTAMKEALSMHPFYAACEILC